MGHASKSYVAALGILFTSARQEGLHECAISHTCLKVGYESPLSLLWAHRWRGGAKPTVTEPPPSLWSDLHIAATPSLLTRGCGWTVTVTETSLSFSTTCSATHRGATCPKRDAEDSVVLLVSAKDKRFHQSRCDIPRHPNPFGRAVAGGCADEIFGHGSHPPARLLEGIFRKSSPYSIFLRLLCCKKILLLLPLLQLLIVLIVTLKIILMKYQW